ncbi:hypothetical protein AN218_18730 [Streptomyces nanshensis]|uniref:Uncharacterized protein n=1 Tax=Streptomyces nanshensis TaxID=518642 RepID=A0A1E7L2C5_9ACTN|nr:hypothetical protein AN218_18730 [Streptomyces nanshensis]
MTEYQDRTPLSVPSGRSSASIEPTSNRRSGKAPRAYSIIAGDWSTPKTSSPDSRSCAVS